MTEPKSKADKSAGNLSATAISHIRSVWREKKYGRKKFVKSKYLEKGVLTEEHCLSLLSRQENLLILKNQERKSNKYLTGECDVAPIMYKGEKTIFDAKSCWSLDTFHDSKLTTIYEYQGRGYMHLWAVNSFVLVYFLVNAPDHLIEKEISIQTRDARSPEEEKEITEQVIKNMTFDDIPEEERYKMFHVKRDFQKEALMITKVMKAQEYYKGITL